MSPDALRRLLADLPEPDAPHPIDAGLLGEYAFARRQLGQSLVGERYPRVEAHLRTECQRCQDFLDALRALVRQEELPIGPTSAREARRRRPRGTSARPRAAGDRRGHRARTGHRSRARRPARPAPAGPLRPGRPAPPGRAPASAPARRDGAGPPAARRPSPLPGASIRLALGARQPPDEPEGPSAPGRLRRRRLRPDAAGEPRRPPDRRRAPPRRRSARPRPLALGGAHQPWPQHDPRGAGRRSPTRPAPGPAGRHGDVGQYAFLSRKTAPIVLSRIFTSNASDQFST